MKERVEDYDTLTLFIKMVQARRKHFDIEGGGELLRRLCKYVYKNSIHTFCNKAHILLL